MTNADPAPRNDLAARVSSLASIWWLPTAAIVAAIFVNALVRTAVWAVALSWMGAACLLNAYRCGRVHCYFTGPFYIIAALTSLLYGFGSLPLGHRGWESIGIVLIIGSLLLNYVPERIWGRYRESKAC